MDSPSAATGVGVEMHSLISELFPICRSITGDGFRETLRKIQKHIPLDVREIPTGTEVFDWVVPKEWNIRDAYIKDGEGNKILDFARSNLHVVGYSVPVHKSVRLEELKQHVFTLPDRPDWIPYRTTYYEETWGFCMSDRALSALEDGEYEVLIDSSLVDGSLTYAEHYIEGQSQDEVLISCHSCHPSLANDNLSGMAVATHLAKELAGKELRYSYRFLFIPGTIGSITWLALNERLVPRIKHGLVIACVGDAGGLSYKKSRRGDAEIDRAVEHALRHREEQHQILSFSPYGYDERQYCSPGFDLPVGCLMRTPHGSFAEYHTSADNLDFVTPDSLAGSLEACVATLDVIENNRSFRNTNPKCEPQLGKRGLYSSVGAMGAESTRMALLWVLNLSDGAHSLLDIADTSGLSFDAIAEAANALLEHELLEVVS